MAVVTMAVATMAVAAMAACADPSNQVIGACDDGDTTSGDGCSAS